MKRRRKGRARPLYSPGQLNRLVDDLLHPLFKKGKLYVVGDGILHGLVERDPPLSVQKFLHYNLHHLLDSKKAHRGAPGTRKRHYTCTIPVNRRFLTCRRRKAGPQCLSHGGGGTKCLHLSITYKSRSRTQSTQSDS